MMKVVALLMILTTLAVAGCMAPGGYGSDGYGGSSSYPSGGSNSSSCH